MNLIDPINHRLDTWGILKLVSAAGPSVGYRKRSFDPWRTITSKPSVWGCLNKVAVLGEEYPLESHSGCVNALHWSKDGSVLVSAGDDTRIHLWHLDPSRAEGTDDYPLRCTAKIQTGHTANIFSAQILGNSSRIVTCAGDSQVRVFDVNHTGLYDQARELTEYQERQACVRVLKCHRRRVKRIIAEDSPDYFLTVSEDGTVRQHDLRTPHSCTSRRTCPQPLLKLPIELSTISMSHLTPYNFVVAGESPYAYLFDRRHSGRRIQEEWGVESSSEDLISCVRRFGRKNRNENEMPGHEHITGSRMSQENGHELLLSYSADGVYLYSTRDPPEQIKPSIPALLASNKNSPVNSNDDVSHLTRLLGEGGEGEEAEEVEAEGEEDEETDASESSKELRLPVVLPRRKFVGACNIETVKDVNFIGLQDEYIVSGSDDGNFFIWDKHTGEIIDILEGDESVVNVVEQHPFLPILAVSGIDETVKIFSPSIGKRNSSRVSQKDEILSNNVDQVGPRMARQRMEFSSLLLRYRDAVLAAEDGGDGVECIPQ